MHSFITDHRRGIGGTVLALALGMLAIALPSGAAASDRNHDKIPDRWEKRHGLSLKVNQAKRDQDADQLVNRTEWRAGLDPRDDDSDEDGIEDGDEGAGTISSYFPETTGLLTIDVFGDGQVTGLVTDETEISCDDGDDQGDEDGDDEDSDGGDDEDSDDGDDEDSDDGDDEDSDDDEVVSKSDDDPADDEGDSDDEDGDDGQECSTADLQVGAIVQEAELEIESGVGLVFEEIELIK